MGYLGAQQRHADPLSGLIQMGARSYDPSLGRFMTEDPVYGHAGIGASFDRYAYAWDNPLNLYDLDGRDVCIPSPWGDACAGEAAEDIGNAAGDVGNAAWNTGRSAAGAAGEGINAAWNWTAPGRQWVAERARHFVKQINLSTNEFIVNVATIVIGYRLCSAAAAGALAVGTPAAGGALALTCGLANAVGYGGAVKDIFDDDNSLWTEDIGLSIQGGF